jgi:hypothetical protein
MLHANTEENLNLGDAGLIIITMRTQFNIKTCNCIRFGQPVSRNSRHYYN